MGTLVIHFGAQANENHSQLQGQDLPAVSALVAVAPVPAAAAASRAAALACKAERQTHDLDWWRAEHRAIWMNDEKQAGPQEKRHISHVVSLSSAQGNSP